MPLVVDPPNAAGILGLEEIPFPPNYARNSGGSPILPADEVAIVQVWGSLFVATSIGLGPVGWFETLAAMAAAPGPAQKRLAWQMETSAPYEWVPNDASAIDGWIVLGATGGVAGRWILRASEIQIAPIDGVTNDWPRLASASVACAYKVKIQLMSGTWICRTKEFGVLPNGAHIVMRDGVIIDQALAVTGGHVNAAFTRDDISTPGLITAPTVDVVRGARVMTIPAALALSIGDRVALVQGNQSQSFGVVSYVGTTLTVDRSILGTYTAAGAQLLKFAQPQDITIEFNRAVIRGTGDRYVSIVSAWRTKVTGARIPVALCSEYVCSLDTASLDSGFEDMWIGSCGTTGLALEAIEGGYMRDCWVEACTNDPAILLQAAYATDVENSHARTGSHSGFQIGFSTDAVASRGVRFVGCTSIGNAEDGFQIVGGSADVDFVSCEGSYNGGAGLKALAAGGGTPSRVRGNGFRAIGNDYGVLVDGVRGCSITGLYTARSKTNSWRAVNNGELDLYGYEADEDGDNPGGALVIACTAFDTAVARVFGFKFKSAKGAGVTAFENLNTSRMELQGGSVEQGAAVGGAFVCGGGVMVVSDVKTVGCNLGLYVGGFGAVAALRQQGRVNVSSAANPKTLDVLGTCNVGTLQLNGAVAVPYAFSDLNGVDAIRLSLRTRGGTVGPAPGYVPTNGTGLSVTGTALDTSTYDVEIGS